MAVAFTQQCKGSLPRWDRESVRIVLRHLLRGLEMLSQISHRGCCPNLRPVIHYDGGWLCQVLRCCFSWGGSWPGALSARQEKSSNSQHRRSVQADGFQAAHTAPHFALVLSHHASLDSFTPPARWGSANSKTIQGKEWTCFCLVATAQQRLPLPRLPPLDFSFPTALFSPLLDNMEGGRNVSGMLIPCSCGWVVREIRELLLNRPLWPGYKSEQLQQHDPGNTQSTLSFPDGCRLLSLPSSELSTHPSQPTPAHPCRPAQGHKGKRGERRFLHLLCAPRALCRAACRDLSAGRGTTTS